jgi:hypothetical protein
MIMRNNMLEPIAIVYFPFITMKIFIMEHLINMFNILFWSIFFVILSIWLSWIISKNLTKAITKISDLLPELLFW